MCVQWNAGPAPYFPWEISAQQQSGLLKATDPTYGQRTSTQCPNSLRLKTKNNLTLKIVHLCIKSSLHPLSPLFCQLLYFSVLKFPLVSSESFHLFQEYPYFLGHFNNSWFKVCFSFYCSLNKGLLPSQSPWVRNLGQCKPAEHSTWVSQGLHKGTAAVDALENAFLGPFSCLGRGLRPPSLLASATAVTSHIPRSTIREWRSSEPKFCYPQVSIREQQHLYLLSFHLSCLLRGCLPGSVHAG